MTERRGTSDDLPPPPYNPTPANPPSPFVERRDDTRPPEPPFGATEDFLIEPGSGYRGRNGNSNGLPPRCRTRPIHPHRAPISSPPHAGQRKRLSARLCQLRCCRKYVRGPPDRRKQNGASARHANDFRPISAPGRSLSRGNLCRHWCLRSFEKPSAIRQRKSRTSSRRRRSSASTRRRHRLALRRRRPWR